jgi:hypothetical protein
MRASWRAPLALGVLILLAGVSGAHPGFEHYAGPITAIDDDHVEIKTAKATVSLRLDGQTKYLRKGKDVPRGEARVGVKVVADARREKGKLMAKEIHFIADDGATDDAK